MPFHGLGLELPYAALVGGASLPARAANLRAAFLAYGGRTSHTVAMSSPPTVTSNGSWFSSGIPGLGTEYDANNDTFAPKGNYFGGVLAKDTNFYGRFPVVTEAATGGNLGAVVPGKDGVVWRCTTYSDAPTFGYYLLTGSNFRILVDDQYVSLAGQTFGAGGGVGVSVAMGSRALRKHTIEGAFAAGFYGVAVAPGDIIQKATINPLARMIVAGDSFSTMTGATVPGDGWSQVLGDGLGVADLWSAGVGGTGFVSKGAGSAFFNLTERLSDINSNGPWDGIVVAVGFNDKGQSTATINDKSATCLNSFRTNNPNTVIFVVGPWDADAPLAPDVNYAPTKAAIQAGMAGVSGCYFIDMQGVSYTKSDAVHPDTAGHLTLGNYITSKIRAILRV